MSTDSLQKVLLAGVLALAVCASACADASGPATRTISVTGNGEAEGPPDQAQVSAGVQTMAETVAEASQQNQATVERIMQALERQGIDETDIQTSNYSIWPEQRHDGQTGEVSITGYRVSNMVSVVIDDITKVGEVLAAVTNAGANSVHGVNFGVRDTAALEESARKKAMEDARARAESLAELAGVELGEVQTISMSSGGGGPVPMMRGQMMAMDEAAPTVGISPGQLTVSVQLNVTFAIR